MLGHDNESNVQLGAILVPRSYADPTAANTGTLAIEVKGLKKVFTSNHPQPRHVLNGISFSAAPGEIIGIFGPSGCGKTTLLRILCGVLSFEGQVLLFNRTVREQRGTVAYVPQRAELLYWKTLFSNALLGWSIKTHHLRTEPQIAARARELFERFRLADAERKYPKQSSGGERQRTAFIRALLTPAQVLALDEPVGAIDHIARAEIYQTLLELVVENNADKPNRTVLMVSHDPEELLFLCDRVLVLPKAAPDTITDVTVPFARPRDADLKFTPDFVDRKRYLWSLLK